MRGVRSRANGDQRLAVAAPEPRHVPTSTLLQERSPESGSTLDAQLRGSYAACSLIGPYGGADRRASPPARTCSRAPAAEARLPRRWQRCRRPRRPPWPGRTLVAAREAPLSPGRPEIVAKNAIADRVERADHGFTGAARPVSVHRQCDRNSRPRSGQSLVRRRAVPGAPCLRVGCAAVRILPLTTSSGCIWFPSCSDSGWSRSCSEMDVLFDYLDLVINRGVPAPAVLPAVRACRWGSSVALSVPVRGPDRRRS